MALPTATIDVKKAKWIFLSGETEGRHLSDIVLGVDSLKKIGVPPSNIYIFTDHLVANVELKTYGITLNIFHTSEFTTKMTTLEITENVFVTVTGHGCELGIPFADGSSSKYISPDSFVSAIRKIPGLKTGIATICQCYAGIFNYVEAFSSDTSSVNLALLGGTNLSLSLSLSVTINPSIKKIGDDGVETAEGFNTWSANIFLFYFFEWLRRPVDIDGDGRLTLMDLYKYAGAKSSDKLRRRKCELVNEVEILKSFQLDKLVKSQFAQDEEDQIKHLLDVASSQKNLNLNLEVLYVHQEPWVLNSNFARRIYLEQTTD